MGWVGLRLRAEGLDGEVRVGLGVRLACMKGGTVVKIENGGWCRLNI